jgi:hypothetical protein
VSCRWYEFRCFFAMKPRLIFSAAAVVCCSFTSLAAVSGVEVSWNEDNKHFQPASAHEGPVGAFLGEAKFDSR